MNFLRITGVLLLTAWIAAAETRVRIKGMRSKSEGQLIELMGDRLAHVEGDPASASRADDAAFLLTQVMRKDGYSDVSVTPRVVNSREILLTVDEGTRLSLGTVEIRGIEEEDADRLSKLYKRPALKDRPIGSGSEPFREEDIQTGLSYISQDLNAAGYWQAEAVLTNRETTETGEVNVVIDVKQGPLFRIANPKFTSTDGRGIEESREAASAFIGKRATTANVNGMRVAVQEAFIRQGYPQANIAMIRTLEAPRYLPEFTIDLGKRVRLNQIHIEGLKRTNPKGIRQRVEHMEGDWYDEAAMNERLRQFLGTGAFSSANVETTEVGEDRVDATLRLEEARAKEISLGLGFDSYEGPLFRSTYTDRNLWGELVGFSTGFELSARGVLGEVKLSNPWLYGSEYSMTSRLYALSYAHEGYSTLESGADTVFSRKFGKHYKSDLLFGYSIVNITGEGIPLRELGETVFTHPRVSFTQTIDYRDNAILPKNGWYLKMPLQIGAAIGDDTTGYLKGGISGGWYHELNKKYGVSLGGNMGFLIPSGDSEDVPIDLRLFNGGARSVRSFPERELGPRTQDDDYPTGGEASWTISSELTRVVSGPVSAVAFVDAGTLDRAFDDFGASDVEIAAGLGLRLNLPIGPVRLEYGYNLTRDANEPAGALHFAIGLAF